MSSFDWDALSDDYGLFDDQFTLDLVNDPAQHHNTDFMLDIDNFDYTALNEQNSQNSCDPLLNGRTQGKKNSKSVSSQCEVVREICEESPRKLVRKAQQSTKASEEPAETSALVEISNESKSEIVDVSLPPSLLCRAADPLSDVIFPNQLCSAKPPYSYNGLIIYALMNSPTKCLKVCQIYDIIGKCFPFYTGPNLPRGWKNSLRHSLSHSGIFLRVKVGSISEGEGEEKLVEEEKRRTKIKFHWALNDSNLKEVIQKQCTEDYMTVLNSVSHFAVVEKLAEFGLLDKRSFAEAQKLYALLEMSV